MKSLRDYASRGLNSLWYRNNPLFWLLVPLSLLVRFLVWFRRLAYRRGWFESIDVGVPVIVVGNLTTGGTGKTPLTIWLARSLADSGHRVGIVCSGYGGSAQDWPQLVTASSNALLVGDEPCLLARRTGCPVAAGPDRVAAAQKLIAKNDVDLILSDDGLQHYRLKRSVEIVVMDSLRGFGNGFCLPAGPLREPVSRLRNVDAIAVNASLDDSAESASLRHPLAVQFGINPVRVDALVGNESRQLLTFAGLNAHAVAAIGHPERFFDALRSAGIEVLPHPHADHAVLTVDELQFDDDLPVLITEKDAVKCIQPKLENVWVVLAEVEIDMPDAERLLDAVRRKLSAGNAITGSAVK